MIKSINDADALLYKVVDLDTGSDMANVIYADDETGEYTQLELEKKNVLEDVRALSKTGKVSLKLECDRVIEVKKKGNIKLVYCR